MNREMLQYALLVVIMAVLFAGEADAQAKGELRAQWHHVVDIAPTVLEAAGLPFPKVVNGTKQKPFEGVSLAYTFNYAKAKGRHRTQYFEVGANRAIYHDGWLAGKIHNITVEVK